MMERRTFLRTLAGGTVMFLGASWVLADEAKLRKLGAEKRPDGEPRLPPDQYPLERLRPMCGEEGDPSPRAFRLKIHGEVEQPYELDLPGLLAMPQVEQTCDVHCVTKWTALDT